MEKIVVYKPKKGQTGDPEKLNRNQLSSIGKIHLTVCSPDGKRVVGFLVKRPDIAGMVKQKDVFIALDSFAVCDYGLVATRGNDSFDDAARKRLHLPWEKCIIWAGMDAKTTNGRELGWVADFTFDGKSGEISTFFVGDGGVAGSLVGYIEIPASMLRGYEDGFMLVDPEASKLELDGGLAAKAGEGYARAKVEGKAAGKKAAKVAGTAVEKGAYGLGKLIGKAKRSIEDYQREDGEEESKPSAKPVEVESISEPVSSDLLNDGSSRAADDVEVSAERSDAESQGTSAKVASTNDSPEVARDASQKDEQIPASKDNPDAPESGSETAAEPKLRTFVAASEAETQAKSSAQEASAKHEAPAEQGASTKQAAPQPTAAAKKPAAAANSKSAGSKSKSKAKSKSVGDEAARAFGRGLGKMNNMFGAFVDEYKKSSK